MLDLCARAIDLVERHRYNVSGLYLHSAYLCVRIALYARGVQAAYATKDTPLMLERAELSKARSLLRARPPSDMGHRGPRTIHVPPGHYPPPGECRVWYPDRPPGHQPSPGSCHHLHAGHGAFVLYNGHAWDADYDWRRYARRHPGTVPKVIIKIKSR